MSAIGEKDLEARIKPIEEAITLADKVLQEQHDEDAADDHPEIKKTIAQEALDAHRSARHAETRELFVALPTQIEDLEAVLALEEQATGPEAVLRDARFGPAPLPYPVVSSSILDQFVSLKDGKREFGGWEQATAYQTVELHNVMAQVADEMSRVRVAAELKTYSPRELAQSATEAAATGNAALLRELRREHSQRHYASDTDRALAGAAIERAIKSVPVPANVEKLRAKFRRLRELSARVKEVRRVVMGGKATNDAKEISRIREHGPVGALKSRREDADAARQRVNAIVKRRLAGLLRDRVA